MDSLVLPWVTKIDNDELLIGINLNIYPLDVLFRTCYIFTDRCYLFLSEKALLTINVRFAPFHPEVDLHRIAGEFCNELINQNLQKLIANETRAVRELIVAQAFAEADLLDGENSNPETLHEPEKEK